MENKVVLKEQHFVDLNGIPHDHYIEGVAGYHGWLRYDFVGTDLSPLKGQTALNVIVDPHGLGDAYQAMSRLSRVFHDMRPLPYVNAGSTLIVTVNLKKPLQNPEGLLLSLTHRMWDEIEKQNRRSMAEYLEELEFLGL